MQLLCRQFAYSGTNVKPEAQVLQIKRLAARSTIPRIGRVTTAAAFTHHLGAGCATPIDSGAANYSPAIPVRWHRAQCAFTGLS
jgi:hypothetical protein